MCLKRTPTNFDDLFGPGKNPVYLYDCFGSERSTDLPAHHLHGEGVGIKWVILDHISILIRDRRSARTNAP